VKYLLVLYPIKEYFENDLKHEQPEMVVKMVENYNDLIRKRWKGYNVVFVLFSHETGWKIAPSIHQMWGGIRTYPGDVFLSCGVKWKDHTEKLVYPKPMNIVGHFPDAEEIVIGGFHMWDCVERIAKCSHEWGKKTFVDEDMTEFFFYHMRTRGRILIDREQSLQETLTEMRESCHDGLKMFTDARKEKPWLVQV